MHLDFDVIVVGVGSMGSAACYHLARRGAKVLGLEQFNIPHALGSHHGQSRMIRLAYFEHPDYVPLLRRTYELWRELERDSNTRLLHVTGGIYLGPPNSKLIDGALKSCRRYNLGHELLTGDAITARFSQFSLPAHYQGLYETEAGFLLPQQAITAHAELALQHGAELHGLETVTAWSADANGVTVESNQASYRAGHVVFTSGAWSGSLLADLGVGLSVTRQVLAWFAPQQHEPFALGTFPVWFMETETDREEGTGDGYYGFPIFAGSLGFKVALHAKADSVDPRQPDRQIRDGDTAGLARFVSDHIPTAAGPLLSATVCLYTYSPDSHFIVDTHPRHPRVTLACGFSGHGFKFSTVMGEVLADLAMTGETELPIDFLRLKRFGSR